MAAPFSRVQLFNYVGNLRRGVATEWPLLQSFNADRFEGDLPTGATKSPGEDQNAAIGKSLLL